MDKLNLLIRFLRKMLLHIDKISNQPHLIHKKLGRKNLLCHFSLCNKNKKLTLYKLIYTLRFVVETVTSLECWIWHWNIHNYYYYPYASKDWSNCNTKQVQLQRSSRPLNLLSKLMSWGKSVTLLAWRARRYESSKNCTMKYSALSWRAPKASAVILQDWEKL